MDVYLKTNQKRVALTSHPFKIIKKIDFSGLAADVHITQTNQAGGRYLNSRLLTRDITIEGAIETYQKSKKWVEEKRQELYELCNPKEDMILEIETEADTFEMEVQALSFPIFSTDPEFSTKNYQTFLLQLTAADPFLYKNKKTVTFASVTPMFSFPLEFNSVIFGEHKNTLIDTIYNNGITESPIEIEIKALQTVTNPFLINIYTQKQIKLNTTLQPGDVVIINTGKKKKIARIRNGVEEVFYYSLDLSSSFLQLEKGDNVLRFGAETGETSMQIAISYKERAAGL